MEDISKLDLIKCPTCGAEYLPVEIFIPNDYFGRPVKIQRNEEHKIIEIIGATPHPIESYTCDYCNVPFRVIAKTQFNTKSELKFDFDTDYTTNLRKESLFLSED